MTVEQHSEFDGAVIVLTLTNQRFRNAIDDQTRWDLLALLREHLTDPEVRALVITGADGTFSAGGDLSSMPTEESKIRKRMGELHDIVRAIAGSKKPVIAAVEGRAFGSGMSLAAACDVVVASRDATFGCTFGRVGLIPDVGLMWSLPRRIGISRAGTVFLRGQILEADSASDLGLVDVLTDGPALPAALGIAAELAESVPAVIETAKMRSADLTGLEECLSHELERQIELLASTTFAQRRAAFLDRSKRIP